MRLRHGGHLLRIGLCATLVSAVLTGSAGSAGASCETVWIHAYDVDLEVARDVYRVGETARVDATVTRKDTGAPVSDARFFAVLPFERSVVFDFDETDAAGHAEAALKLRKKDVELGPARLWTLAYYRVADAQCATVVEYGKRNLRRAFTIKP